jgi:hypothetical protein
MFVREKRIGRYTYVYLVESVREDGRTKQRIIHTLGRKDEVERRGDLDRLMRSVARLAKRSMVLSLLEEGSIPAVNCKRVGAPLLFERLWRDTRCREVLDELLAGRGFEFAVERAVFLTVLHRLMVSGSDRACEQWRGDYRIGGVDDLQLHHLYRAMAWFGEELPQTEQNGPRPAASRIWSRSGCSPADAPCSPISRWCSWTPRRCISKGVAARASASAVTRRTTGRSSTR